MLLPISFNSIHQVQKPVAAGSVASVAVETTQNSGLGVNHLQQESAKSESSGNTASGFQWVSFGSGKKTAVE
jgi:hypothetical protein